MKAIKPNWTWNQLAFNYKRWDALIHETNSHPHDCLCNLCMEEFGLDAIMKTFSEDEHAASVIRINQGRGDELISPELENEFMRSDEKPEIWLFDKPSGIKARDWKQSEAVRLMVDNLETEIWISADKMNAAEKEAHPHWETTNGYLKSVSLKEAWAKAWSEFTDAEKRVFLDLPNFDAEKFKSITGLDVSEEFNQS